MPVKNLKIIRVCSSKKVLIACLRCFWANAHTMGNKQKLKAAVQLEICDLITITGIWWDESGYWSGDIGGYKLFGREKEETQSWGQKGCPFCKKNKLD